MNVTAVFAPKKAYELSGSGTFNCVVKHKFAATTRTRLMMDTGRLHGVLQAWEEVRNRGQTVQMKNTVCTGLVSEPQIFGSFSQVNECAQGGNTQRPSTVLRKMIV